MIPLTDIDFKINLVKETDTLILKSQKEESFKNKQTFLQKIGYVKDKLFNLIFNRPLSKSEMSLFLNFLSKGLRRSASPKHLLQAMAEEYLREGKLSYFELIKNIIDDIEQRGIGLAKCLWNRKIINNFEYNVLLSNPKIYEGLDFIINARKRSGMLPLMIMYIFIPPLIGILMVIYLQPEAAGLAQQIVAPINDIAKGSDIAVPKMLADRNTFTLWAIWLASFFGVFMGYVYILRSFFPQLYIKLFPFIEREIVLEMLYNITNLRKAGYSMGKIVELLSLQKNNPILKAIYKNMSENFKKGKANFYHSLLPYNVDPMTIGYLKIAASTSNFIEMLDAAIEYNEEKYKRSSKLAGFLSFYFGQIALTGILLMPAIELIMLSTSGLMNGFKV